MKPRQLAALLALLRQHGVTEYVTPEMTLRLGPLPQAPVVPRAVAEESRNAHVDDDEPEFDPNAKYAELVKEAAGTAGRS